MFGFFNALNVSFKTCITWIVHKYENKSQF